MAARPRRLRRWRRRLRRWNRRLRRFRRHWRRHGRFRRYGRRHHRRPRRHGRPAAPSEKNRTPLVCLRFAHARNVNRQGVSEGHGFPFACGKWGRRTGTRREAIMRRRTKHWLWVMLLGLTPQLGCVTLKDSTLAASRRAGNRLGKSEHDLAGPRSGEAMPGDRGEVRADRPLRGSGGGVGKSALARSEIGRHAPVGDGCMKTQRTMRGRWWNITRK